MDVECDSGFPAAGFEWSLGAGQRYATYVAKRTFALAPLKSELAKHQEALAVDADAMAVSVHDGAPFKRRAEVMLIGSAYATLGPTTSLMARLIVGDVDKSILVLADRHVGADGQVGDGPGFTRMPLTWERAGRGSNAENPLGAGTPTGRRFANIVAPGTEAWRDGAEIAPVGFGPVPENFPLRRARSVGLYRNAEGHLSLTSQVDPDCFQAAPEDQWQKHAFEAEPRIVLENLHAQHGRLVTSLEAVALSLTMESRSGRRETKTMTADTLLIDTDRGICTLTYRCSVALNPGDPMRATVRTGNAPRSLEPESSKRRPIIPSGIEFVEELSHDVSRLDTAEISVPSTISKRSLEHEGTQETVAVHLTALPFGNSGAGGNAPLPPPLPSPPPPNPPPLNLAPHKPAPHVPAPPKPASANPPPVHSRTAPPPAPKVVPPPVEPSRVAPAVMTAAMPATGSSAAAASAMPYSRPREPPRVVNPPAIQPAIQQRPLEAPSALLAVRPELRQDAPPPPPRALGAMPLGGGTRAPESATAASDGAADRATSKGAPVARMEPRSVETSEVEPNARRDEPLELLFADDKVAGEIRAQEDLRAILGSGRARRGVFEKSQENAEDDRVPFKILSDAPARDGSEFDQLTGATFERAGRPPLVVVSGELVLKFDEREALRAVVGVAAPFVPLDKALKDASDFATSVLDSEWSGSFSIDGASSRLRDALAKASRDVSRQQVDATVQRALLERRKFRTVRILGGERIRADLVQPDGRGGVPFYMPIELKDLLPLFERLPVRAIVEVRNRQDSAESHPHALFVRALARRATRGRS